MATHGDTTDNEWEDVLLCSYTPFGENCSEMAKLSPQRLQSLIGKAQLVLTQIIGPGVNKKLPPLSVIPDLDPQPEGEQAEDGQVEDHLNNPQLVDAALVPCKKPTLLDQLYPLAILQDEKEACYLGKSTVYPGGFLGAIGNRIVQLDSDMKVRNNFEDDMPVYNTAELRDFSVAYSNGEPVRFYKDGKLVHESTAKFNGYASRFTAVTKDYVYFRSDANSIVAIDADFNETTEAEKVEVFTVDRFGRLFWIDHLNSMESENLCSVTLKFNYLTDPQLCALKEKSDPPAKIKDPTISLIHDKQIAVAMQLDLTYVFLHRANDLRLLAYLSLDKANLEQIYNIRVGKPAFGIVPLVFRGERHFFAVGIYNNQLHYLTKLRIDYKDAFSLGNVHQQWIYGGYGRLTSFVLKFG